MNQPTDPCPQPIDDLPLIVDRLLGGDGQRLVSMALRQSNRRLESIRPLQVRQVAGKSSTIIFQAQIVERDGSIGTNRIGVEIGPEWRAGTVHLETEGLAASVWEYPNDPDLPGLAAMVRPGGANAILGQLGVEPAEASVILRSYRPGRRATLELSADGVRVFAKISRPSRISGIQRRHVALQAHVRIPRTLGWDRTLGIVVLESIEGRSLKSRLRAGKPPRITAAEITNLADMFPEAHPETPAAHDIDATARFHHQLLLSLDDAEISAHANQIEWSPLTAGFETPRWIHGDFHTGQLLLGNSGALGIVDVDRAGLGQPIDDIATFSAHCLHLAHSQALPYAKKLANDLLNIAYERYDEVVVRDRVCAVLLALSTMPYAGQHPGWRDEILVNLDHAISWSNAQS